jgi:hypothetical protein
MSVEGKEEEVNHLVAAREKREGEGNFFYERNT